uniref:Cytochrome c oxidase subunit 2 n=1 Tax=Camarochiloides weiweii TaxID=2785926 RepID=A0A873QJQ9_9HEMI|nr:cytochrome c oxidase subunit II [Camarochiloides weiweii]
MPMWAQLNLQDAVTPLMEQMVMFHDHTMMILTMITIIVSYIMINMFMMKATNRFLLDAQTLESIWTILPGVILIFIAMPSLHLLYTMDEVNKPVLTVKAIGHQWYWSYEYSDFRQIEFDSYMKSTQDLQMNEYRLLEVDNRMVLPMKSEIRLIVTAADVLHSWTVPSIGIKIDATPGRLNQGSFELLRPGVFYGQCSEICGANHSFMPIVMESANLKHFLKWLNSL